MLLSWYTYIANNLFYEKWYIGGNHINFAYYLCISTLFVIMCELRVLIHIFTWVLHIYCILNEYYASLLILLRDTTYFFAIFFKKTLPWKPSICDVAHNDVKVMRDTKPKQNLIQEKLKNCRLTD